MSDLNLERTVIIEGVQPEEVYEYIADYERHTEWNSQPQEIKKVAEGPVDVGSRFHTEEDFPDSVPAILRWIMPIFQKLIGAKGYIASEITAMEPNKRFAWQAWIPRGEDERVQEVDWEILLEPHNGGTKVTQRSEWVGKHWSAKPSAFEDMAAEGMEDSLNQLKETVEGAKKSDQKTESNLEK